MEKIINKLYEMSLNTAEPFGFFDKESTEQEWRCYDSLYDNLSKEDREIFREYVNLRGLRSAHELQAAYEKGFKTAIQLLMEALKE